MASRRSRQTDDAPLGGASDGDRRDHSRSAVWLAELFRTEQPRLSRVLRRRVPNPDDVADIIQDAFMRMMSVQSRTLASPRAYLQRVIGNLLVDRAKRAEHRFMITRASVDERDEPVSPPEQHWAIEANELMSDYAAALAKLSPRTRAVFLLHRVDELRYREIAMRLGISVATVEYHMARALAQLDEALNR